MSEEKNSWRMIKGLKIKGYKCFLEEDSYQGFDELKQMNVIIGRNNSGKSKLIEIIEHISQISFKNITIFPENLNKALKNKTFDGFSNDCSIYLSYQLQKYSNALNTHNAQFEYRNFSTYKQAMLKMLPIEIIYKEERFLPSKETEENSKQYGLQGLIDEIIKDIVRGENIFKYNVFERYQFCHISAERDIKKEVRGNLVPRLQQDRKIGKYDLGADGKNITMIIQSCLHARESLDSGLKDFIENDFLDILNSVINPDIIFTRIDATNLVNDDWEIVLYEKNKKPIVLSECGSGLKTIIFTLFVLHAVPKIIGHHKIIYAFEELENNLHPAVERRLLQHIRDVMKTEEYFDALLLITTHSHIAIDIFSREKDAQIVNVENKDGKSTVAQVLSHGDKHLLLDSLGVKASDLLQSNAVIWIEGPSDRIYIKKWLELFADKDNKLEEGIHYEFVQYGGSNLASHTASTDESEVGQFIQMIKVCRNSFIVMDSDKMDELNEDGTVKTEAEKVALKERVEKIIEATDKHWITFGKEVENYNTLEMVRTCYERFYDKQPNDDLSFEKSDSLPKKLKVADIGSFNKTKFASKIMGYTMLDSTQDERDEYNNFLREQLKGHLDLEDRVKDLMLFLKDANQIA